VNPSLTRQSIQGLILDMDGVLWRDQQPIGDLHTLFGKINAFGWKTTFATNNATRNIQQYIDGLHSFGVSAETWQVITSATAVTEYLLKKFPAGGGVYIVGEQGVIDACAEHGFYQSEDGVVAVIVGFDRKLTYDKLKTATLLIRSGVPFIGTNPDLTFPTPEGLIPGAGSILAAVTAATGVTPVNVGKPEPVMYQIALERLNIKPEQTLVIGDRLETDIACGQALDCRTALVLSGVSNINQAASWSPPPDIIAADLETVIKLFE
jgi:4-nitrophenyl phosphatase